MSTKLCRTFSLNILQPALLDSSPAESEEPCSQTHFILLERVPHVFRTRHSRSKGPCAPSKYTPSKLRYSIVAPQESAPRGDSPSQTRLLVPSESPGESPRASIDYTTSVAPLVDVSNFTRPPPSAVQSRGRAPKEGEDATAGHIGAVRENRPRDITARTPVQRLARRGVTSPTRLPPDTDGINTEGWRPVRMEPAIAEQRMHKWLRGQWTRDKTATHRSETRTKGLQGFKARAEMKPKRGETADRRTHRWVKDQQQLQRTPVRGAGVRPPTFTRVRLGPVL